MKQVTVLVGAVVFIAAAVAAGGAGAAPAGPRRAPLPLAGVITEPDWLSKPTGEDVARYYPAFAQQLFLSGEAIIRCMIDASGVPQDCKVQSETPAGFGFGPAALQLSAHFRMKPKSVDGVPVAGGEVRVPINFNIVDDAGVSPPKRGVDPTPAARALAERIVAATAFDPATLITFGLSIKQLTDAANTTVAVDPAMRDAAVTAAANTVRGEGAKTMRERRVEILARQVSEDTLAQVAAFFESPAGKAWTGKLPELTQSTLEVADQVINGSRIAARTELCKTVACAPPSPAAGQAAQGTKP